jgi:exosome complex component RRP41
MSYTKRVDGRKFDETREMSAKVGVVKRADGSAMFKIGKTIAIASVYGPREFHPMRLRNPQKGLIRCNYNMMSFSGGGDRVRPGPSRRSREISFITENAISNVVNLEEFPGTVVDVFIEMIQTDAGTRCAGICAASLALADAGIPMKDLISAIAVGMVGDKVLVDLSYDEESHELGAVDIPIAILPKSKKFTLLQMDGILKPSDLKEALLLAEKVAPKILEVQRNAIKESYKK